MSSGFLCVAPLTLRENKINMALFFLLTLEIDGIHIP